MRIILIVLALLICQTAHADQFLPRSGISSYVAIVAPQLPAVTKSMSPEEFHAWAVRQNELVAKQAHDRDHALKSKYGDRTVHGTISEESTKVENRMGGGVGFDGFGGQGGYAGYSQQMNPAGIGFNYGYGFSNPGNATQVKTSGTSKSYEKVWYDNSYYGGTVTVINPFCPPSK